jgi:hypothetical protein
MIFRLGTRGLPLTITLQIKLKKTETSIKGHEKSRRNFEKKVISEEITNYNSRIYQLYMNVTKMLRSTPFI